MVQFRERNPIPIALFGIGFLVVVLAIAFSAPNIALLGGGGKTYYAEFQEASNVQSGDDVRIAGIKVGQVKSVKIAYDKEGKPVVKMGLKVDSGTSVPDQTSATVKIKTLLGAMYVDLIPAGTGQLKEPIPLARTTTPLIVTAAFQQLSKNVDAIDTTQLANSFNTLASAFSQTPSVVSQTLKGLSAVSQTISSRNQKLQTLFAHAQGVTTALASQDAQITTLLRDGQTVLTLVTEQRDVIHNLLVHTTEFSQQITALVQENQVQLKPALKNLGATVDILTRNQRNLDSGIHLLAPFVREFTNTIGSGPYFDSQLANLPDLSKPGCFTVNISGSGPLPDTLNMLLGANNAVPFDNNPQTGCT